MDRVTSSASQSRHRLMLPETAFPYRRELSLDSLIAAWETVAATLPFQLRAVHATPGFRRLLLDADGTLQGWVNMSAEGAAHGRLLYAYDKILRAHYGMTLDVDYPLILAARDPDSGLERHFRIQFDTRFLEVRALRPLPPLDETTRAEILRRAQTEPYTPDGMYVLRRHLHLTD